MSKITITIECEDGAAFKIARDLRAGEDAYPAAAELAHGTERCLLELMGIDRETQTRHRLQETAAKYGVELPHG